MPVSLAFLLYCELFLIFIIDYNSSTVNLLLLLWLFYCIVNYFYFNLIKNN